MPEYSCTICHRPVVYDDRLPAVYPFCSPRCKMVDLGRWFGEKYGIERELLPEEEEAERGRTPRRESPD